VNQRFFPPSGKTPDPLLFSRPQFNTWIELTYNQNQEDILDYARKAVAAGFPPGVLMIDEGWFKSYGDWDFDRARFEDPKAMIRILHDLGFKVMVWVCPFITPDGPYFSGLQQNSLRDGRRVWMSNPDNPPFPAIMQWWDGFSAVVDLTNPFGKDFLKGQLDRLVSEYGIDGFKFDGGDAEYYSAKRMLTPFESYRSDVTSNGHSEEFARLGLDFPLNEYRACWKMGGQPLAQRLRDKEHNWEDLRKLIPGIINQGLMGYPFTCPDLIGGGEYLSFVDRAQVDQELIVRAARTGEPVVRSLEYEFPHRGYMGIGDQFLLGERILVAPVLEQGARARSIVFPPGSWKGDDGSVVNGPRTLEVEVPLGRLPRYRKVDPPGGI
jgi:alpha-glucosidase (family GH31 glycosyl hydrolase)